MPRYPKNSYSWTAIDYAKRVKSGKIIACVQVRQACDRFLALFARPDLTFDVDRIDHVCEFAEAMPHVVGPLSGEPIKLEPFQIFIFANLFGWLHSDTRLRLYREAFILLPRGNAKSTIAAIIANYMTFFTGQGGAESMCGATSLAQADAVFAPAKRMLEMSPDITEWLGVEVNARSIYQPSSGSSFKPVIASTKDGGLPWCAIADELHQAKNGVQLAAFRTGMGKRRGADPLLLIISTAGTNVAGVCRQEQYYFEAVVAGTMKDDSKFCLVYTIDKEDSWRDFKVWKKANPNYGVSVDEKHLHAEYKKVLQSPSSQADALTKYLNVWCNTATGWLNQKTWADAAVPGLKTMIPDGASIWAGVDLSTRTDITAVTFVAKLADGRSAIIPRLFLPRGALDRSKNAKGYAEWIASGAITETDGEASDHSEVEDYIRDLGKTYRVEGVLFDVWQGAGMMQRLAAEGVHTVEFAQKASNFGPAMNDFEADLLNKKIAHDDNAAMNWMASNISVMMKGPFKSPSRPSGQDHLKIDGMITALMAYAGSREEAEPEAAPILFFV